jgi:hypothetical protein
MAKDIHEEVKKKLRDGWIKSSMMIEVLAVTEEAAKSSLEKHVHKMEKEDKTIVYKKEFRDVRKIEKPLPNIESAYSYLVELELLTENFEKLIYLTYTYGPSSIEILEPHNIKMDAGEAQGILNSIAEMIHRFAASGIGGVIIST